MDSGTLLVIIVAEAIIIVWLMSKLKQYRKFEHLLSATPTTGAQPASASPTSDEETKIVQQSARMALSAEHVIDEIAGDELLEEGGVDPEANIEEAKRVQLVMARCRYAEFYLEQLDDDYERGQFKRIVKSCIATAQSIADPFFRASALHPLIVLLDKAEWHDRRDQLMADVQDDIVMERIIAELKSQSV